MPSVACATLSGTSQRMSIPSRWKKRSGCTWNVMIRSPGAPPGARAGPGLAAGCASRVSVAGGTVMVTRFSVRTSPAPRQVGHGCEGILPRPRHCGQGRLTAKPPWPNEIVPRPSHSGQVDHVAPGAPPLPAQVGQASVTGMVTVILPPERRHPERHLDHRLEGLAPRLRLLAPRARRWTRRCRPARRSPRSRTPRRRRSARAPPGRARPGAGAARPPVERAQAAHLVVLLPLLGVGEHAVRLGDLLEALGRLGVVGVGVRVVLLGEPAVRLLDIVLTGRVGDAQDLIEVLGCHRQAWPCVE